MSQEVDHPLLDLRGVICPYNFVKTKLKLDTMQPGQVLEIFLDDGEPIRNVRRALKTKAIVFFAVSWSARIIVLSFRRLMIEFRFLFLSHTFCPFRFALDDESHFSFKHS